MRNGEGRGKKREGGRWEGEKRGREGRGKARKKEDGEKEVRT